MRGLMSLNELDQLKAVERGDKPICCISPRTVKFYHTDLKYIEVYLIARVYINNRYSSSALTDRIYYSIGNENKALKIKELWERPHGLSNDDHRTLGKAFGYEDDEIDNFIKGIGENNGS